MADILIRGIEMPQRCKACRFCGFGGRRSELNVCMFTGESQPKLSQERMSKCPLVPVPPHGRLIDADVMVEGLMKCAKNPPDDDQNSRWFYLFAAEIAKSCETIVPAEGGTDNAPKTD